MAQVRPIKLSGNKRAETDPTSDEITFLSVTSPNFIAGDIQMRSKDGKAHWRLVEHKNHIAVINENTGELFRMGMTREMNVDGNLRFAKCNRCGKRAKRKKTRCMACNKKQKKVKS